MARPHQVLRRCFLVGPREYLPPRSFLNARHRLLPGWLNVPIRQVYFAPVNREALLSGAVLRLRRAEAGLRTSLHCGNGMAANQFPKDQQRIETSW
jgi:hypothetical protein